MSDSRESNVGRRQFLESSAVVGATALVGGLAGSVGAQEKKQAAEQGKKKQAAKKKPLYRISLAQWSLNRRFFKFLAQNGNANRRANNSEEPLDPLDFAKTARELKVGAVEYVNQFFKDKAKDMAYLGQLKQRAKDHKVKSLLIMIDGEGNLGEQDATKRMQAVENHYKWVEAAKFLGCHSIRVNARSNGKLSFEEQMKLAADGLRKLTEFGAQHDINVIVENHGGLSSHGKWLVGVMKLVDHPRCGTLPDFGNFAINRAKDEWYDRYMGVKELMPYAKAVSAKAYAFDKKRPLITIQEGTGKETDYLKMMRIVVDAGYNGFVGIESEGKMSQMEGVKATRRLLLRARKKLTEEKA